jgi:phosphopantothenoylcysteine decarboxylase/phosphopantothenate--cysteine ligase
LIVGGGIAAYKALELARLLRKADVAVRPILTRAGAAFVTPLSLSALAEDKVYADLFSLTDEAAMGHIELSRSADLIVVAPAMNVRMWEHPATRRNLATLKGDGVRFVGPDEGPMACGEFGFGRMAEPEAIFCAILAALDGDGSGPLKGKRVLVTAGPTAEPIDPVRVLTNRSSGKQGYAIAEALARLGAEVTLVSGPTALAAPCGVNRVSVETAREMLAASLEALPVDAAVCVAAVADWRTDEALPVKLKKGRTGPPALNLVENPDILATIAAGGARRPKLVIGFAAETGDVEKHARAKLKAKGCDWIVANDVSQDGVMGGDENEVLLVYPQGLDAWPRASKAEVATRLARRIAEDL